MDFDPIPTRADFAARVIDEMRDAGLEGEVIHDAIAGTLVHAARGPFDLEAAYRRLVGPDTRPDSDEMLTRLVRIYVSPPAVPLTWLDARDRVLPAISSMAFQAARAFQAGEGQEGAVLPFAVLTEHVTAELAFPLADGSAQVSGALLAKWGVDFKTALDQATTNLARRGALAWISSPKYPGVFRSPWDDGFDASRILVPGALRSMSLRGDPVLMLHAPTCVYAVGADDATGLFQLGLCAKNQLELNRGTHISRPIRKQGDRWVHWMPPQNHPAHATLRLMSALGEKRDYDELVSVTRQLLERKGIAARTPSLKLVQSAIGAETRTVTTWTDRTACALPEADGVIFKRGGETLGVATFDAVRRTLAGELQSLAVYPKRWLGRTFPAEWQLAQMGIEPWREREA